MNDKKFSAEDVANWMVEELTKRKNLYQEQAAWDIKKKFGNTFVYDNANGNPAISKDVLNAFGKLTIEDVVWSRSERVWRKRGHRDKPGRQQE